MMYDLMGNFIWEASAYMIDAQTIAMILLILCVLGVVCIGLFIADKLDAWKRMARRIDELERQLKEKESNEEA